MASVRMNTSMKPFDDIRVRRAFNYAIDKSKLKQSVLFGTGDTALSIVPPIVNGYDPSGFPYSYDPAKAKALLAEAGFANFDASFYFGVAAPRGTPADIAAKFAAEAAKIVATPEFKAKFLTNLGFEPVTETPEQFANFLKGDRELAAQKVKISGAKLD